LERSAVRLSQLLLKVASQQVRLLVPA